MTATEADITRSLFGDPPRAEAIVARTREPEVKQKLIDLTQAAVDRGVFGSPAFFAGDRQFFGKDRMNLFEAAIVRGR